MNEQSFYSFLCDIHELVKTKKLNERIVVKIYDPCDRELDNNDKI